MDLGAVGLEDVLRPRMAIVVRGEERMPDDEGYVLMEDGDKYSIRVYHDGHGDQPYSGWCRDADAVVSIDEKEVVRQRVTGTGHTDIAESQLNGENESRGFVFLASGTWRAKEVFGCTNFGDADKAYGLIRVKLIYGDLKHAHRGGLYYTGVFACDGLAQADCARMQTYGAGKKESDGYVSGGTALTSWTKSNMRTTGGLTDPTGERTIELRAIRLIAKGPSRLTPVRSVNPTRTPPPVGRPEQGREWSPHDYFRDHEFP